MVDTPTMTSETGRHLFREVTKNEYLEPNFIIDELDMYSVLE